MSSSSSTRSSGRGGDFDLVLLERRTGSLIFQASGKGARKAFEKEPGGHRHQRIPPTEKRGRVHTSTVTVAVLSVPTETEVKLDERDLDWTTCRASGPGGQKVNKTESAVQVTHRPSGIQVRCESERSQLQNRVSALSVLRARLQEAAEQAASSSRNDVRRAHVGSGQRGDKTRSYRWQDGVVTDQVTGKKAQLDRILRGFVEDLS